MEVKKYQHYAGGVWRDAEGGRTFDDLEPYSGKVFAKVADADLTLVKEGAPDEGTHLAGSRDFADRKICLVTHKDIALVIDRDRHGIVELSQRIRTVHKTSPTGAGERGDIVLFLGVVSIPVELPPVVSVLVPVLLEFDFWQENKRGGCKGNGFGHGKQFRLAIKV